jgi:phenylalanyl-tRNA synthetase beta chain
VAHDALMASLRADPSGLIRTATLFDVYKPQAASGGMAVGERSLAVRLELLDFEATLTEDRIESVMAAAVARVAQAFGARLRA